jgi:hypothetical protein
MFIPKPLFWCFYVIETQRYVLRDFENVSPENLVAELRITQSVLCKAISQVVSVRHQHDALNKWLVVET